MYPAARCEHLRDFSIGICPIADRDNGESPCSLGDARTHTERAETHRMPLVHVAWGTAG